MTDVQGAGQVRATTGQLRQRAAVPEPGTMGYMSPMMGKHFMLFHRGGRRRTRSGS